MTMIEFYSSKHHKAIKNHICDMCGAKIQPGEIYQSYCGKYDGYFFNDKYCKDCETIIREFTSTVDCEYSEDDIVLFLQEEFCCECTHGWETGLDDCENISIFHCPCILAKINEGGEHR